MGGPGFYLTLPSSTEVLGPEAWSVFVFWCHFPFWRVWEGVLLKARLRKLCLGHLRLHVLIDMSFWYNSKLSWLLVSDRAWWGRKGWETVFWQMVSGNRWQREDRSVNSYWKENWLSAQDRDLHSWKCRTNVVRKECGCKNRSRW